MSVPTGRGRVSTYQLWITSPTTTHDDWALSATREYAQETVHQKRILGFEAPVV